MIVIGSVIPMMTRLVSGSLPDRQAGSSADLEDGRPATSVQVFPDGRVPLRPVEKALSRTVGRLPVVADIIVSMMKMPVSGVLP
jgi:hypothetical protein